MTRILLLILFFIITFGMTSCDFVSLLANTNEKQDDTVNSFNEGDGNQNDLENIIWFQGDDSESDAIEATVLWNGLHISRSLSTALSSAENSEIFAIDINTVPDASINRFVYNGKTYEEYSYERDELRNQLNKLQYLEKEGLYLKYGEALYTTGTPSGEKWAKELYEQKVAYYGAQILEKYIVDGAFSEMKVIEDITAIKNEIDDISRTLEAIRNEYSQITAEETFNYFKSKGYNVHLYPFRVLLYISKEDFSGLNVANVKRYVFSHASFDVSENDGPIDD